MRGRVSSTSPGRRDRGFRAVEGPRPPSAGARGRVRSLPRRLRLAARAVTLDDQLRLEGRVLDLIRTLNDLRKVAGLELTDRIRVTVPEREADLLPHADWIKDEVLAVALDTDASAIEPIIVRA